ncbi:MAG: hypothetical protein FMLXV1_gp3 [Fushun monolepta lauta xinmovirus 1]|uniref:Nonstructural protein WIV domain-containing protein n=1 Tax=Fushun monolepta lauta xinmovirus 1 TaxID=2905554 RepID=A0A8K1XY66_9MONO|nr:MAG: hypothetical protein FMLXV1_gp3 [Fushun monolepta lauta xinmovirus 1]
MAQEGNRISFAFTVDVIARQRALAARVLAALKCDKVYLYDFSGEFNFATKRTVAGVTYVESPTGKVGLLSTSAQKLFQGNANTYRNFSQVPYPQDNIGVYMTDK